MSKVQKLLEAAYHYYVLASPIMSDEEYDKLYEEVKLLNPELCNRVCLGYFEGNSTEKVKHEEPMLSIEKDNNRVPEEDYVTMPKLDGVACELVYKRGLLVYMLTRGDGYYGSDITKYQISNIPYVLATNQNVVVRGELMCADYKKYGKSHRNIVAGTLGLNDIQKANERGLKFYAYWTSLHNELPLYTDELTWLVNNDFYVPPYSFNEFISQTYNYPTDGVVYRLNDNRQYGEYTSHHYKNIWCWKPETTVKESKIIAIEWKKSKNSVFTPVAVIEPVEIDETTIKQVNLMSMDYIHSKDIAIGDSVLVRKAKGIIPEITEVVERPSDRQNIFLEYCPSCGSELEFKGIYLTCSNPLCALDKQIEFFCKTVGIKGLAIKNIEKLNLSSPLDLYFLSQETLYTTLGKIGITIEEEIYKSIKNTDIVTLLAALNPPRVKQNLLRVILSNIDKLDDLLDYDKLVSIKGVGDIIASGLVEWYRDFKVIHLPIIKKLGFDLTLPKYNESKIISLTGTLPEKRADFVSRMSKDFGITIKNSVTKSSKLLIIGDKPSQTKINKATKYNIPIVDYYQFIQDIL